MKKISRLLLLSVIFVAHTVWAEEMLKLLPRSHDIVEEPGLNASEWRWLREHRTLRLAVWLPMSPPYDITTGLNDYGGISADFIGLAAENLNVKIEVIRYPNYDAALAALRAGKADFLAQAGDRQRLQGLILSEPYSPNQLVEVMNTDTPEDEVVKRLAIKPGYDIKTPDKRFPDAEVVPFSSSRHALEALAFRKIDRFYCDAITARYLIGQSNLSNLRIRSSALTYSGSGFSFAAMPDLQIWITILNKLLTALPENVSVEIHRRWNGGIPLSLSEQKPVFTALEHKWIKEHTNIRVAVAQDNAPVAWFDESGQLRGFIADILTALRLRTGFNFEIRRYPTQQAALTAVKQGEASMVAGVTQENIWQMGLLTTRTWLYNSWVMVGRAHHAGGMHNPRFVSLRGQSPEAWLQQQNGMLAEKVDTWHQGLTRIAQGKGDMMAMPLLIANTQLSDKDFAALKIMASIDIDPMRFSFGASQQSWPLITILNKALLNIPPEDLHALTRSGNSGTSFTSVTARQVPLTQVLLLCIIATLLATLIACFFHYRRKRNVLRLLDAIPSPVWLGNRQGIVLAANQALCESLGLNRKQVSGKAFSNWFASDTGRVRESHRELRLWRYPVEGKNLFIGGWMDETRQRHFISTLRNIKRRANRANHAKSVFLATMSHEIRTPVSAILGMLELVMKRTGDTPQNRQSIQVAWDAAQSLLQLIGNILDVSRIESGRLILRPARASLRALVEEAAILFEGLAAQKSLSFVLEMDASLKEDVLIDRGRFRQILVNLLGNAINYTDHGQVVLRVLPERRDGEYLLLRIEVEDTGQGIDEATRQRLFRPFMQGNSRNTTQGSGLGLYICQSLAEMMGGSIDLQSEPGCGTRITVMLLLPILAAQPEARSVSSVHKERSGILHILIVDDNPVGRLLFNQQLGWLGHRVTCVESSKQALEKLGTMRPDAVITDCTMPDISGFELAHTINTLYPGLPVFGATADARESVREEAREAGMRHCLFKPITLSMLSELLASVSPSAMAGAALSCIPKHSLPTELLSGDNLVQFLSLQIGVLDETLASITRWRDASDPPLHDALHKLRGGLQLLGAAELERLCEEQEKLPDAEGIHQLVRQLHALRTALVQWRDTGLQPGQTVLQQDEEAPAS